MTNPLPLGKLPADLLARLLGRLPQEDPRVLVGARPGVDAAAVAIGGRALIVTSDPITFPTDRSGWYAVNVNANDIAVMGGDPRWFLVTVLLPEGSEEATIAGIFDDLIRACAPLGISLVGGHTEVTYGIDHPIISGTMLGEAEPERVITSAGVQPGDRIIVTGGIAIEGTSILAGEAREALTRAGVSEAELRRAAGLLTDPGISVVRAARTLREAVSVHAMHDATEGGLAAALREMAEASGAGVRVDAEHLPILTETATVCAALGLDPLGLLASGCLIAAMAAADVERALSALHTAQIDAWLVGEATDVGAGMWLVGPERRVPWPAFDRDELARWLEQRPL
jgi:hydrogenase expression/formation protein HypE